MKDCGAHQPRRPPRHVVAAPRSMDLVQLFRNARRVLSEDRRLVPGPESLELAAHPVAGVAGLGDDAAAWKPDGDLHETVFQWSHVDLDSDRTKHCSKPAFVGFEQRA